MAMRESSVVAGGKRIAIGAVRCRVHVEIVDVTVGVTIAPTIASCKRRLRHPLVIIAQAAVKNKERMHHMHVATMLRQRRTVRDAA